MRKYFGKLFGTHKVWMAGLLCVTVALALIIGNHAFAAGDTVTLHIYKFWGSTEHAAVSYRYVDDVTNAEIMDSVTEIKPVGENYSHTPPSPIISGGRTYNYVSADAPLSDITLSGGLVITLRYRQQFTITYHPNGGTGSIVSINVNQGSIHTVVSQGYTSGTFNPAGYSTAANGTGTTYLFGQSFIVDGDITLYARWIVFA